MVRVHRAPAARSAVAREQPEGTANGGESSHGESGGGESGGGAQGRAMLSALCTSTKAATCRRDAEEDGARRRLKRVRCEHARNARLHRGCCTAHLPDEALCADDVLRAAGEENLYQESEDSAKVTGSRMAFASRG